MGGSFSISIQRIELPFTVIVMAQLRTVTLPLMVLALFGLAVEAKLADYITICKAKDPALDKCLVSSGQKLFQQMEKGIPEFDIKPVDPMSVPHQAIQRTDIGMQLVLSNATHRGMAQATIQKAHADPANHYMEFSLKMPQYSIIGHYDINGKVMLLPITGNGDSNITLYDLNILWKLKGEPEVRDGETYLKLNTFTVTIQPKLMKVRFDNLFNGNKVLGDTMNDLLNAHWQDIYRKIKPALEKSYSDLLTSFSRKIFSKTPYNQIFAE